MPSFLYFIIILFGCVEGLNIQRGTSNASPSANDIAQALVVTLFAPSPTTQG